MTTTTPLIEFETERLLLRQWQENDKPAFAAMNADPKVMEFFPATLNREQSDALADRIISDINRRGWGLCAVEEKASGKFIGFVGLDEPRAQLPCSPCVEIGWRLATNAWGKGYATEAARCVLGAAFEKIKLSRVVSFTALPNLKSQAVMQRIGLTNTGENFLHPSLQSGHPLQEHCLYQISAAQYRDIPSFD